MHFDGVSMMLNSLRTQEGAIFTALAASSVIKLLSLRQARAARDNLFEFVGQVKELYVYPVKSCGAVQLQSATASVTGLSSNGYHDRRWAIQTETGEMVNMKTNPKITLLRSEIKDDWLILSAPNMAPLQIPCNPDPTNFQTAVMEYSGSKIKVLDCGKVANDWMSKFIGQRVRLFHSRPGIGTRDAYDMPGLNWETTARRGDEVVFAYLTSYLLTTTASLAHVNSKMDSPVTSVNFRSNIVVSNTTPFEEDEWEEVKIGTNVRFHYVQPCRRCVITTVNPDSGILSEKMEPLRTLRSYRQREPYGIAPLFGAYVAVDRVGEIRIGDPVYAIKRQPGSDKVQ